MCQELKNYRGEKEISRRSVRRMHYVRASAEHVAKHPFASSWAGLLVHHGSPVTVTDCCVVLEAGEPRRIYPNPADEPIASVRTTEYA